ncbi:hypothetical protein B7494_g6622 [Chlorociboria aeruginascens]|nr:hypothetical protein B7494_g6622 [Chlorociboria aeruginascens]
MSVSGIDLSGALEDGLPLETPQSPASSKALDKDVCEEAPKETNKGEEAEQEVEAPLPQLSAADFRTYNSMAEHMDYFHDNFRRSWTLLDTAVQNNRRPNNLTLKQFLNIGIQFCHHLSMHHNIEEQHIFPILAAKMPEFKSGKNAAELLRQHQEIHKGMDLFEEYLEACRSGELDFEFKVLKVKMLWGDVLWKHLEQEVKTLGAENMRKYWSLEEMRRMPM